MKNQRELFFLLYHWALNIWNWKGNKRSEREATELEIYGYLKLWTPVYPPGQVLQVGVWWTFQKSLGNPRAETPVSCFQDRALGGNKCYRTPWHPAWGRNNRVEIALQYLCVQYSIESCQEVKRAKLRYISGLWLEWSKLHSEWDSQGPMWIHRTLAWVFDDNVLISNNQISIILNALTFSYSLGLNQGCNIRYRRH